MEERIEWCPECGSVLEHVAAALATKEQSLRDLERELRTKRARISRLEGERDDQQTLDPQRERAREVYDYWRAECQPRAREFNGERFAAVSARLKAGHSVAFIKIAIDGAKARPRPGSGPTDLKSICRNEENLLMYYGWASQNGHAAFGPPDDTPQLRFGEEQLAEVDDLASRIGKQQMKELSELGLIGLPPMSDEQRRTVAASLWLAARSVLEGE